MEKAFGAGEGSDQKFFEDEAAAMVERIRSLMTRFPEDEEIVRELAASNAGFAQLCQEYHKVVDLLDHFESEVNRLRQLRTRLEEALLACIEGQPPH